MAALKNAKLHRAQFSYRDFLEEIYVPINGDFQEPLSMTSYTCCSKIKYTYQPEKEIQLKQQSHTYQLEFLKWLINFDIIILVVSSLKKYTFNTKFVCTVFIISKLLNACMPLQEKKCFQP